jgi:hypothetical protein
VSLRRCLYALEKLPADMTCGGLCPEFPACLPAPSSALLADLATAGQDDRADHRAVEHTLRLACEAINERLNEEF